MIIPWRGGCDHRARALRWVLEQLRTAGFEVRLAESPEGPWCKAAAVNPAVLVSDADVVVVHDADVWCDGLPDAVKHVETWSVPHQEVLRLTEASTRALVDSQPGRRKLEESYMGLRGGGIVVAPRQVLVDVPLDGRFKGWGDEDTSWAYALWTLVGKPWRGGHQLVHLWHPPQPRLTRDLGSVESRALHRRYKAARFDPERMRALVEEGRPHVAGVAA